LGDRILLKSSLPRYHGTAFQIAISLRSMPAAANCALRFRAVASLLSNDMYPDLTEPGPGASKSYKYRAFSFPLFGSQPGTFFSPLINRIFSTVSVNIIFENSALALALAKATSRLYDSKTKHGFVIQP